MKIRMALCGIVVTSVLLSGCMSRYMVNSESTSAVPPPGMALLVFLRPASMGGDMQATLFEVSPDRSGQSFIGVASYNTKIALPVKPGKHLFMVIGENADFMDADLAAGKTYYVLVSGRIGVISSRYSLLPVHRDAGAEYSTQSTDFAGWQTSTRYIEKAPNADQWYQDNKTEVDGKRIDYLKKWNGRSAQDKVDLYLHANDGS